MQTANAAKDRSGLIAAILLIAWFTASWTLRPDSIVADWEGWRQADTQTIAVNGLRPEARFNVPMINWGSTKPTAVEAEFQLYTSLITPVLKITGQSTAEWPGQLISALSFVIGGLVLFVWLRRRYGAIPALAGLVTLLIGRAALFLGNSIQPDGLGLALMIVAWINFDDWVNERRTSSWVWWVAATLLSSLAKPTNLQLGIAQFLFVCLTRRDALKAPALWVGWAMVLAANALQLWHGAQIHTATGLTFGVVSGGDSKFPALGDFLRPGNYLSLVKLSLVWGIGPLGIIAVVWAALRRDLPAFFWALGIAHLISLFVALNYTTSVWWGTYYHAPANFIGALMVAYVLASVLKEGRWAQNRGPVLIGAFAVAALAIVSWNIHDRATMGRGEFERSFVEIAKDAREVVPSEAAILVRTDADNVIRTWREIPHNHEDPRLLYLLNQCGWALWVSSTEAKTIAEFRDRGAQWLIEPYVYRSKGEQEAWLRANAELMVDRPEGRIWKFTPAG
ncbi:MAG: glycosyltransferase family 39 protein [Povalibacter sp.]